MLSLRLYVSASRPEKPKQPIIAKAGEFGCTQRTPFTTGTAQLLIGAILGDRQKELVDKSLQQDGETDLAYFALRLGCFKKFRRKKVVRPELKWLGGQNDITSFRSTFYAPKAGDAAEGG